MSKVAKRNRMVKIFCVILMVCMFLSVANVAFGETTIESITGGGANLGEQGNELVKTIVSWLTGIGMAVSVIVLLILGIKYMIGSAEEKAEYKKDNDTIFNWCCISIWCIIYSKCCIQLI